MDRTRELIALYVHDFLLKSPQGVIDVPVVANFLHVPLYQTEGILQSLTIDGPIKKRLFWNCPKGLGVIMERDFGFSFPSSAECACCGDYHRYDISNVSVGYVSKG